MSSELRGYRPIADYALIGDCHGCALVGSDGGVDWCTISRFDADPLCCRLLDADKGGFLAIRPRHAFRSTRRYLDRTNILVTEFETATGRVSLTDFMPLGRQPAATAHDYVHINAPGWLIRSAQGLEGSVEIDVDYRPTVDFAKREARLSRAEDRILVEGEPLALHSDIRIVLRGNAAQGSATLAAGERRFVVIAPATHPVCAERIDQLLRITHAFWTEWLSYSRYRGPYREQVERSALALKLMTYAPTGACVAAATTSLPEWIGGSRNWDYRFCWIRDATLMLHALSTLGYSGESKTFFRFLCETLERGVEKLQVLYGIGRESDLTERQLEHLEGYRASRPVRVGNGASGQRQTDLYGYILQGAMVYRTLGGKLSATDRVAFSRVVDFIESCWQEPDMGLWEIRGEPRHFVHSKAMCWVVVDCAIQLLGERRDWHALRERIWQALMTHGRYPQRGHFLQSFHQTDPAMVDAALLQLPLLGLPIDKETMRRTREAVERELRHGDFVWRYRRTDDGVGGPEGNFLVCSFWLVDALLVEDRAQEARVLFGRLLNHANDVGLFAEQIEPQSGAFLGNFPQAFTHLGLVSSAINLELYDRYGSESLRGGYAGRARRSVGATFGWRGVLAALMRTGHVRLFSSRESQLNLDQLITKIDSQIHS